MASDLTEQPAEGKWMDAQNRVWPESIGDVSVSTTDEYQIVRIGGFDIAIVKRRTSGHLAKITVEYKQGDSDEVLIERAILKAMQELAD